MKRASNHNIIRPIEEFKPIEVADEVKRKCVDQKKKISCNNLCNHQDREQCNHRNNDGII